MQQLWCNGALRSEALVLCQSFWLQLVGRHAFPKMWNGVVMIPTSIGVHTFGMQFPMIGIWLSTNNVSLGTVSLLPNKAYLAPPGCVGILETSGDALSDIPVGARFDIRGTR
jgi:hypothetical protein